MDRFERLLDGDATDYERELLDSAADDVPSEDARRRTLAAMGVGAGTLGASTAGHAATKLAAGAAGTSKSAGTVSAVVLMKWLGTGAVVGSVVAASVATVTTPGLVFSKRATPVVASERPAAQRPTTPPHERRASRAVTAAVPAVVHHEATPATGMAPHDEATPATGMAPRDEATPATGIAPARAAARQKASESRAVAPGAPAEPPVASRSVASLPAVQAASGTDVAAEVHALDLARAALAAGDARTALTRVGEHDAAFPRGVLAPESVVLRVRALVALGDREEATRVANRFIDAHPETAQAHRLRAIVGER